MSRFRAVFASRHVVLPVIHVVSREQALRNAGSPATAAPTACS